MLDADLCRAYVELGATLLLEALVVGWLLIVYRRRNLW